MIRLLRLCLVLLCAACFSFGVLANGQTDFRVRQISIHFSGQAAQTPQFQAFRNHFPIQSGQYLDLNTYENTKTTLFQLAEKMGYVDAHFIQHLIAVDRRKKTADIFWIFDTGDRYLFGPINWSQSTFAPSFLRRFSPFKTGEVYNHQKVLVLRENLMNSGYFSSVNLSTYPALTPQPRNSRYLPVVLELAPQKSHAYHAGFGYGTDTGVRGRLGWDWRRLNRWGHRFQSLLRLSERQNSLEMKYGIPGRHPLTDQYQLLAGIYNNRVVAGDSHIFQVGAAYQTRIKEWQQVVALNLQKERSNTFLSPKTFSSSLLIPSVTWTYHQTDRALNPTQGFRVNFLIRGAQQTLLSDLSFLQFRFDAKYLYPLTQRDRLIARSSLGYSLVQHLNELPLSLNFLVGGAQSVRGYRFESLGPGRYMGVASLEYQHRVTGPWFATTFLDVGNADNHIAFPLKKGIGVGIIRDTPVGPIQLSLAQALDDRQKPIRLVFNVGFDL